MINYRELKLDEFPALAKLRWIFQAEENKALAEEAERPFLENCVAMLKSPQFLRQFTHFGAFDKDVLVSMASVNRISMIPRPGREVDEYGYLTNMYTIENYRGQGIGTELLKHIKEWASLQNFELLLAWPSEKSISFYQMAGFEKNNQPWILTLREY